MPLFLKDIALNNASPASASLQDAQTELVSMENTVVRISIEIGANKLVARQHVRSQQLRPSVMATEQNDGISRQ
jgi:hypothetical protein